VIISTEPRREAPTQELSDQSSLPLVILLALCLLFSVLRWLKTESFWGDSGRWIFEAWRSASGEVLYRDFAWQYGPLPLLLFAAAFRLFGATFAVAQVLLDLISTMVVYLTWQFGRRVLPPSIAFAAALALLGAGAGNTGNFALFSLQLYTPAILVGMAGFLLAATQAIDYFRAGKWTRSGRWTFATGTAIALLSKPEYIVAVGGLFLVLAVVASYRKGSRRLTALAELTLLTFAPAVVVYLLIATIAGGRNLAEGLGGYGMAYLTCPWWPTGLGLFGALTALLQAALALALFSLTDVAAFRDRHRVRYYLLWALTPFAIATSVIYLPYCMAEMPVFHSGRSIGNIVSFYLSTGTVLLPVMWAAIVLCIAAAMTAIRSAIGGHAPDTSTSLFLLLTLPAVLISSRSLFGGTMSQLTVAAVAAYPIWFVLAPRLLLNVTGARMARTAVLTVMMGYALLRLSTATVLDWRTPYTKVVTQAGAIKMQDATAGQLYRYVSEHVASGEPMLDLSYGGGLNLATHHPSPLFSTQFSALAPSDRILARDLDLIQRRRPRIVIAPMEPGFGATYGICMDTGCPFPAFVFRSSTPACTPGKAFPVLSYIAQHYTPVAAIGSRIVYIPKQ
jgi:hypothetical protein